MENGGANFFYHADALGSITEITNQSGTAVQRYTYSSFGEIESQFDVNFVQPYAFTSREFDAETGLYFYRARYYDSSNGRFLQEDTISVFSPRDVNRYLYVLNSPVNFQDPSGLQAAVPIGPLPIPLPLPPGPVTLTPGQARDFMDFVRLFDPRPFSQYLSELIDKINRGEPITPEDIEEATRAREDVKCEVKEPSKQLKPLSPLDPKNPQPPQDPLLKAVLFLGNLFRLITQILH